MKYRKKPVVIDALEWKGTPTSFAAINLMGGSRGITMSPDFQELKIVTLEGVMTAQKGDFIIKGVSGELYPCKPAIFHKTYDAVEK